MQRKNMIRVGLTGFVLAASLLLLSSDRPVKADAQVKEKKTTCCKKVNSCGEKSKKPETISVDNLSRQFI